MSHDTSDEARDLVDFVRYGNAGPERLMNCGRSDRGEFVWTEEQAVGDAEAVTAWLALEVVALEERVDALDADVEREGQALA